MNWIPYCDFYVLGEPKGQPRPRAFSRGGKASVYDPATAEGWKGSIALKAGQVIQGPPPMLDMPLRVVIIFYFQRPARLIRKKDPDGLIPHTAKPDSDNAAKAVLDCLTSIGMWRDDSLVYSLSVEKYYAVKGKAPGARISIYTCQGLDPAPVLA
jgi:Holliday junction resolvase RusA-like endonuclease